MVKNNEYMSVPVPISFIFSSLFSNPNSFSFLYPFPSKKTPIYLQTSMHPCFFKQCHSTNTRSTMRYPKSPLLGLSVESSSHIPYILSNLEQGSIDNNHWESILINLQTKHNNYHPSNCTPFRS
jgi:hypothetical protein